MCFEISFSNYEYYHTMVYLHYSHTEKEVQ